MKINEIRTRKKKQEKINETKTCFFENIDKIDKPSARLTKEKRERAKINKIRNEGKVITDSTEIQKSGTTRGVNTNTSRNN